MKSIKKLMVIAVLLSSINSFAKINNANIATDDNKTPISTKELILK